MKKKWLNDQNKSENPFVEKLNRKYIAKTTMMQ